jgi:thiamine biosynthesis lipoprotein
MVKMKVKQLLWLIILLVWAVLGVGCTRTAQHQLHQFSGKTMGTTFTVKIVSEQLTDSAFQQIQVDINALLKEINRQMSTYIPDSEISQFNLFSDTAWFAISDDFAYVLQRSLEISAESRGALDITVAPLVNLWGFGPKKPTSVKPSDAEIEAHRAWVGYQKLKVRRNPPAVKKLNPKVMCDLSATAKGFGVDKVVDYLEKRGFLNYFVEIGGEARARGKNENGSNWHVGIISPDEKGNVQKIVVLDNMAIATSGDYFNYKEIDGIRYSHTINPITGKPITHHLASVSVLAKDCLSADAYATAIDVMGPEQGLKFAKDRKLPVYLIVREKDGFVEKMNDDFKKILELNK